MENLNYTSLVEVMDKIVLLLRSGRIAQAKPFLDHYDDLRRGYRLRSDHAEIPLTNNHWVKVSLEDLPQLLKYKWFAVGSGTLASPVTARAKIRGTSVHMARYLLGLSPGDRTKADHINYNNLDNRRTNLRIASATESSRHRRGWKRKDSTLGSDFKGVYARTGKNYTRPWVAAIKIDGKIKKLGYFSTEEEAAEAYNSAAKDIHGDFVELNQYG